MRYLIITVLLVGLVGCAAGPQPRYVWYGEFVEDTETGRWYRGDLAHEVQGQLGNVFAMVRCRNALDDKLFGSGADASYLWAPGWDRTPAPAYPDVNSWGRDGHLTTGRYDPALNRYTIRSYGR